MDENGERKRATISDHVHTLDQAQVSREDKLRFKLKVDEEQLDDLISYNELMEYLEDNFDTGQHEDGLYKFKSIKDHRGPYTSTDPGYLGSSYNLIIEWESGKMTWEPATQQQFLLMTTTHVQYMPRNLTYSTHKDGSN